MPRTRVAKTSRARTVRRVRGKKREGTPLRWIILGHLAVIFCSLAICLWTRLETFRVRYEIARQHETRKGLLKTNRELQVEMASLKSPARLQRIAREKLGLEHPGKEQIVWLP